MDCVTGETRSQAMHVPGNSSVTNHQLMLVLIFAVLAHIVLGQIFPGHALNSSNFSQYRELCCIGRWRQRQQVTLLIGADSHPGFTARDVLEMSGETGSNGAQLLLLSSRLAGYQISTSLEGV